VIKYVYCIRRAAGLSAEEFRRYWLDEHAPLVRRYAEALRIRRYAQCHQLDTPINAQLRNARGTGEPFDGVGEIWWDSLDEMIAGSATSEGREGARLMHEDGRNFIDFARSAVFITEIHDLIG
jgi:uncharacterized protein (TIGR02118 family)